MGWINFLLKWAGFELMRVIMGQMPLFNAADGVLIP